MSKLRSVSTAFWSDPFIEDLTPNQKLLFIYLITNEKTNMLGIYELSIKKISFETGIKKDDIIKGLKTFEKINKVKYINNFVILVNYMKHQNFNTNMKKSAIDIYNNLPNCLKDNTLTISKSNPFKGFESLLNHYGMVRKVEVEVEYKVEVEVEYKVEETSVDIYPTFDDFWNLYNKKIGKDKSLKKWNKLNQKERELIMLHLVIYIKSITDKQYLKNPETYLNGKCWNDEIINKNQNNDRKQRITETAKHIRSIEPGL